MSGIYLLRENQNQEVCVLYMHDKPRNIVHAYVSMKALKKTHVKEALADFNEFSTFKQILIRPSWLKKEHQWAAEFINWFRVSKTGDKDC